MTQADAEAGVLTVGYDVMGGQFVWLQVEPGSKPTVHYFGPDDLGWLDLEQGYAEWLNAILRGSLTRFYDTLPWPGWEADVEALGLDEGFSVWPPPFTKEGKDQSAVSRKAVPLAEVVSFYHDAARQLGGPSQPAHRAAADFRRQGRAAQGRTWMSRRCPGGHHLAVSIVGWDDFARLASAPVTLALQGRVASADAPAERLAFAPPDFWRVEDEHGRLRYLANDTGHYQWPTSSGGPACFQSRRPGYWHSGAVNSTDLVRSRDLMNPSDDDFTRPAGPVQETTFIGRPAWRVMLAAPLRKPQPVWQVLDVESGVTLAYQSPDGLTLVGFTSLEASIQLPPGTFDLPGGSA